MDGNCTHFAHAFQLATGDKVHVGHSNRSQVLTVNSARKHDAGWKVRFFPDNRGVVVEKIYPPNHRFPIYRGESC